MPVTEDYYFTPDKTKYNVKDAIQIIYDFMKAIGYEWDATFEQMDYATKTAGIATSISKNTLIEFVKSEDDNGNQSVAMMMYEKNEQKISDELTSKIGFLQKVVFETDTIHIAQTIMSNIGEFWHHYNDEIEFNADFIKYLSKKRLLGKTGGFSISSKPIFLRMDDVQKIIELFSKRKTVTTYHPILLLHTSNYAFIKEVANKFQKSIQILVLDDEDVEEELIETCKNDHTLEVLETIMSTESFTFISKTATSCHTRLADIEDDVYYESTMKEISTYVQNFRIYGTTNCIEYESALTAKTTEAIMASLETKKIAEETLHSCKTEMKALKKENVKSQFPMKPVNKNMIPTGKYLKKCDEKELYEGEIYEILIDSLTEYRQKYVQDKSRRGDILDSILKSNKPTGKLEIITKEVETFFKNYDGSSPNAIREAEKIGFKAKYKSDHLKLSWQNDPRYVITISSTPSENRTGKNAAALAKRTCL